MRQPELDEGDVRTLARMTGLATDVARPLLACVVEDIPAHIALMRLCMVARAAADVEQAITAGEQLWGDDVPRLAELRTLWKATPDAFRLVRRVLQAVDHGSGLGTPNTEIALCAAAFDKAAALSPEASVALYSLGDPRLLAEATAEVVAGMRQWGLLGAGQSALEIGCGIGRFLEALAPSLRAITGIDISAAMVKVARRRCSHLPNVTVAQSSGRDLAGFPDASLELVFAVDSFPYVVRCGADLVAHHFAEAARVLKPSGRFLILNYSYRGDGERDVAELAAMAAATGFTILRAGVRDLRLWDGLTFLLQKQSA